MALNQNLENRLDALKKRAAELDKMIVDDTARVFLLGFARNALRDVESYLLPNAAKAKNAASASGWFSIADFQLKTANEHLRRAQAAVKKYGQNVCVVCG